MSLVNLLGLPGVAPYQSLVRDTQATGPEPRTRTNSLANSLQNPDLLRGIAQLLMSGGKYGGYRAQGFQEANRYRDEWEETKRRYQAQEQTQREALELEERKTVAAEQANRIEREREARKEFDKKMTEALDLAIQEDIPFVDALRNQGVNVDDPALKSEIEMTQNSINRAKERNQAYVQMTKDGPVQIDKTTYEALPEADKMNAFVVDREKLTQTMSQLAGLNDTGSFTGTAKNIRKAYPDLTDQEVMEKALEYDKQMYGARAEAAATAPLSTQSEFDFYSQITSRIVADKTIKNAVESSPVKARCDDIIANPENAQNQLISLYDFIKGLDPESIVRPSETELAEQTQSYWETWKSEWDRLRGRGRVIAPQTAKQLAMATKRLIESWEQAADIQLEVYNMQAAGIPGVDAMVQGFVDRMRAKAAERAGVKPVSENIGGFNTSGWGSRR